jgi:hypothetical protein
MRYPALFALALAACGGGSLSDLIIRTSDPGYQQLTAVHLAAHLAAMPTGAEPVALTNGSRVAFDERGTLTLYVDLRGTTATGHIRLFDEMARGLVAMLKIIDAETGAELSATPVPHRWHSGIRQESTVITHYDRFGQIVITNRIAEGAKLPIGVVTNTNDSLVRFDLRPAATLFRDGHPVVLYLELDYAAYRDPETTPRENRLAGKDLAGRLARNPTAVVEVTAIHIPRLHVEKRRTVPLFVRLVRPVLRLRPDH